MCLQTGAGESWVVKRRTGCHTRAGGNAKRPIPLVKNKKAQEEIEKREEKNYKCMGPHSKEKQTRARKGLQESGVKLSIRQLTGGATKTTLSRKKPFPSRRYNKVDVL